MPYFRFEIIHQSTKSKARVGKIHTPHGIINTPSFVAVGTNGTIKALDNKTVDSLNLELMFCNTYHLLLQPGPEVVKKAGGLHRFINRRLPIITDSGGFQVFSLKYGSVASELKGQGTKKQDGSVLKITEEGVLFRSYRDGQKILLTPESSVAIQKDLGADIIIPLDELPPYHIDKSELKKILDRTHRWEKRSLEYHLKEKKDQAMYGVIHGGICPDLRKQSCLILRQEPFDGLAIGGSVGKNKEEMFCMLASLSSHLPENMPIHLLGIGDLDSLSNCISYGIDTFDSSYPTRSARHGILFTYDGPIKITKGVYKESNLLLQQLCPLTTDHLEGYTAGYLHHLFKANELAALNIATECNLSYMVFAMQCYREKILQNAL